MVCVMLVVWCARGWLVCAVLMFFVWCCLCGYWRVVGEDLFLPPPFFVAAGVPLVCGA